MDVLANDTNLSPRCRQCRARGAQRLAFSPCAAEALGQPGDVIDSPCRPVHSSQRTLLRSASWKPATISGVAEEVVASTEGCKPASRLSVFRPRA